MSTPAGSAASAPIEQGSVPVVAEKEIADAVVFRERFGLRADIPWVRAVAANPVAQNAIDEFGFPLTPDEFADLMSRRWDRDLLAQVSDYGVAFPDDFAGASINLTANGVIIAFKDHVDRHRVALSKLVPEGSVLEVVQVEWSLKDLLGFVDLVSADNAWFDSVGLTVNASENTTDNTVEVRFKGPREARGMIERHFGSPSWLKAEWIGPLPWKGPRADLTIKVSDPRRQPVPNLKIEFTPLDETVALEGEGVWGTNAAGICVLPNFPTTTYVIELYQLVNGDYEPNPIKTFRTELKVAGTTANVVVPAG